MTMRVHHSSIPTLLLTITLLACVFCDISPSTSNLNVDKPSAGLSTSSDTLVKESEEISIDGLNVDQLKELRNKAGKHQFEAEVDRMMKLIINSLYKNKEIFLRELISNSADALDKIRMLSLTNREALNSTDEMSIRIKANKKSKTLHIIDTGIGMTQSELISNLGTIAKSGTSEFIAKLAESNSLSETKDLIGKYGVGFYSAFLVADKVVVISKSDSDEQFIWESDSNSFFVYKDPRGSTIKRGVEIILHLVDEAEEYLEPNILMEISKKYSSFINYPIHVWADHIEKVNVETENDSTETSKDDANVEEEKKSEPKTVDKVVWEWTRINNIKPIWKRSPSEVEESEYTDLYKAQSNDNDAPLSKIHFNAEGDVSFSSILYIPKQSPSNIFQINSAYSERIKLYVNRVFISEVADDMLPKYLSFIFGIVGSDELPLNVSREMLQQNKILKMIKKKLVRKVIDMISKLSTEDFEKFWKEYSANVKLGIIEDHSNRSKLSKLLRFWTSRTEDKQISLDEYTSRMKKDQKDIFYLTGSSLNELKTSPLAERLVKKGYEIIYMVDPLDEYMVQSLTEYDKKRLQNIAKDGVEIDQSKEAKNRKEELEKEFELFLKWLKDDVLKDSIEKAQLSERLSDSPCTLVANQFGWSGNMERIMLAQSYQKANDVSSNYYSNMKKILEINPRHPIIKEMNARVKTDENDMDARQSAQLLFDLASLRSGYNIKNPITFAERIESVMRKNLQIDPTEIAEEEVEDNSTYEEGTKESDESLDEESDIYKLDESFKPLENDGQFSDTKDEL